MALDTQVVELLGRQRLMGELLRDGLEVAVPARDRGVDLIAFADLLLAYVWNLETPREAVTFAMSYDEAVSVAEELGWTKTPSWKKGAYSTSAPSKKPIARLERHKMTSGRWWQLIVGR
ncbi:MAG: hypothetical protein ACKV2Q_30110 [Planctomycetaceae bacterium]